MNDAPIPEEPARLTVRMPQGLHREIQAAAERHGRTVNAEILERLQAGPVIDLLRALSQENATMKKMLKEAHSVTCG